MVACGVGGELAAGPEEAMERGSSAHAHEEDVAAAAAAAWPCNEMP